MTQKATQAEKPPAYDLFPAGLVEFGRRRVEAMVETPEEHHQRHPFA
jgi:hypothetical protein